MTHTKRTILKKKNSGEFGAYCAWYKSRANQRLIGTSLQLSTDSLRKIFGKSLNDKNNFEYSVYDKKSGRLIGVAQIYLKGKGIGGLFILIGEKNFRRKGYGREILKQLIKIGFNELKLRKLKAAIIGHNEASLNLFKNCGFKLAEVKRKAWKYNGKRYDKYVFELNNMVTDA